MLCLKARLNKLTNSESQAPEVIIYQAGKSREITSNRKSGILIYLPDNHREEPTRKKRHCLC